MLPSGRELAIIGRGGVVKSTIFKTYCPRAQKQTKGLEKKVGGGNKT